MARASMIRIAAAGLLATVALAPGGAAAPKADPFEGYYGNTLVCVAAERGNDLCHTWVNRDGTFITFDPTGMHLGHWKRGGTRADGKTPICWYNDSTLMVLPGEAMGPLSPPRAMQTSAAPGGAPPPAGGPPRGPMGPMVCDVKDYRSICLRYPSTDGLSPADLAKSKMTIVERFHAGMCYPLPVKQAGDTWYEDDDPLPGENALDKLFLLKGHR